MAFSELELKRIDGSVGALCRARSPAQHADQLRFIYEVSGHSVTIWEERPAWDDPAQWTRMGVARFRHVRAQRVWNLYWMRRDLKWHGYDPQDSRSASLDALVRVVAADKSGAFFG